jgi:nucleoside-diphosphate-sugar epimerase
MTFWSGQEVLVTGGAGFIGSHLVERLVERGAKVTVADDFSRGCLENLGTVLDKIDVWELDLRGDYWGGHYDTVFLLAAKVADIAHNRRHHFEMQLQNELVIANSFRACAENPPGRVLYASTVCVYPHEVPLPTPEGAADPCNPEMTNYGYGVAKWAGEKLAQSFHREYGVPVAVVRFSNAFGSRDYYDETAHVAPALIRRAVAGQDPFVVWGTGEQSRVLVDARDLAESCLIVAEKGADGQPTNIGHDREIKVKDLAATILSLTGYEAEIVFDTTKPDGHDRRLPDLTRFRRLSGGWLPDTPLEDTLRGMIADCRRRYG